MPTRKMRKFRKFRKGGTKKAIRDAILFTVSGMPQRIVRQFIPAFFIHKTTEFKELLIESVNDYKEEEPEDVTVLEEDIRIHRIRGAADDVLFEGKIERWTDKKIKTFLLNLRAGDRIHVDESI